MSKTFGQKKIKLSFIILIVVLISIIILNMIQAGLISSYSKKNIINDTTKQYKEIAKLTGDLTSTQIKEYWAYLDEYVYSDFVQENINNPKEIVQWLKKHSNIRNENFDYVAYVDEKGNFETDINTSTNVKDREYFKEIMQKNKYTYVDNPVRSKITNQSVIHICKAIRLNGKNKGFFAATMNTEKLEVLLNSFDTNRKEVYILIANNDEIIASNTNLQAITSEFEYLHKTDYLKKKNEILKTNKTDGFWAEHEDGRKFYTLISPVNNTPWHFEIQIEENELYELANNIEKRIIILGILCAIILGLLISIIIKKSLNPLNFIENNINEIASGNADLTKRINYTSNNEIGNVVKGFNQFSEKLQNIVMQLKSSKEQLIIAGSDLNASTEDTSNAISEIVENIKAMESNITIQTNSVTETAGAINQIASNIESLNHMISSQSSSVTQASAAVEEMIGNINSVNNSVTKMAESFEVLESRAAIGIEKQEDVNNRLQSIETNSQSLQEANTVISNIAEQTNLLAMNAAIEAAHAGEAGRGFSVVADEIRKLSETSFSQSKTIGEQLQKITESISEMVIASQNAGQAFSDVSVGINETNNLVNEIKNAMMEQNEGSKEISLALNNMNDSTAEVKTASQEMSEGNKSMLSEITNLQEASLNIKNVMENMNNSARKISETETALVNLAKQMDNSIQNIGTQIDLFKI